VKRACIYISVFILFLNNASLGQLFKLPAFISHFIEHHHLDNSVDIIDFMSMHYWGTDLNDNDNDKDMQLPFKKLEGDSCFQVYFPTPKITIEREQPYIVITSQRVFQDFNLSNPALSSLFRPPRA
jgi:hypothetical protein